MVPRIEGYEYRIENHGASAQSMLRKRVRVAFSSGWSFVLPFFQICGPFGPW